MTQSQLLQFAVEALERLGIEYALVGSIATSTWGEPRFTNDIDIVVRLDVFDAKRLCQEFAGDQFYVSLPAALEAVEQHGQFNVIHPTSANKIDFMIPAASGWADAQLQRRLRRPVLESGDCYVAAIEDLILGKLIYYQDGGSEKHLRDIAGMIVRNEQAIDRAYLDRYAAELGVAEEWQSILSKLEIQ